MKPCRQDGSELAVDSFVVFRWSTLALEMWENSISKSHLLALFLAHEANGQLEHHPCSAIQPSGAVILSLTRPRQQDDDKRAC